LATETTRRDSANKSKLTDAERHKRFVETAKKVEASDSKADFDVAFTNLTKIPVTRGRNHKKDAAP
jgi:hypothetical protein